MITGRSGFQSRKSQRASDSADNALESLMETEKRIYKLCKRRRKEAKTAAAGGPVEQQRAKIAKLKRDQELMKAANKIVRSKPKNERTGPKPYSRSSRTGRKIQYRNDSGPGSDGAALSFASGAATRRAQWRKKYAAFLPAVSAMRRK